MKLYFHLYSDGKKADIPFCHDDLKVFAVNSLAIVAFQEGVVILCYDINDTHLHVVIRATPEAAERFRSALVIRIRKHYSKSGCKDLLGDGFYLACDQIIDRDELLRKIAMLHSYAVLPRDWEYNRDGMLEPRSFVDYEHVESLFVSPRAFMAFLFVKKDDEQQMKQQFSSRYIQERNILDLRKRGNNLCNSYFGKNLKLALFEERIKVATKMLKEGSGQGGQSAYNLRPYLQVRSQPLSSSRRMSFSRMVARLSYSFLPRARAMWSLAKPFSAM